MSWFCVIHSIYLVSSIFVSVKIEYDTPLNVASVSSTLRTPTVVAEGSRNLINMATLGGPRINTERRVARLASVVGKKIVTQRHNGRAVRPLRYDNGPVGRSRCTNRV